MRRSLATLALAGTIFAAFPAHARHVRHVNMAPVPVSGAMVDDRYQNLRIPEAWGTARARKHFGRQGVYRRHHRTIAQKRSLVRQTAVVDVPVRHDVVHSASVAPAVLGGRPSGCPHRFCGCALSLRLFGRIIPTLNLAANWLGFPRAAPAPGMVAARHGHVFQLLAHSGGSRWRVWDANSGHGRIRIHDRSIAGYAIVNPGAQLLSAHRHRKHRRRV